MMKRVSASLNFFQRPKNISMGTNIGVFFLSRSTFHPTPFLKFRNISNYAAELLEDEDEMEDLEYDPKKEANIHTQDHSKPINKALVFREVIDSRRHTKVTAGGRINTFSTLVIAGDMKGTAGIGYGKGLNPGKAAENADLNVQKNLITIYRYKDKTVPGGPYMYKYVSTKVTVQKRPPNTGISGPPILERFARAFGLDDIRIIVHGSKNKQTMLKAFAELVRQIQPPEETARLMGKKLFDPSKVWKPSKEPDLIPELDEFEDEEFEEEETDYQ